VIGLAATARMMVRPEWAQRGGALAERLDRACPATAWRDCERMDSKPVTHKIRQLVWGSLKSRDFDTLTSRSAWRHWNDGIDVVRFRSLRYDIAYGVGCTTFSFTLELGVWLHYQLLSSGPWLNAHGVAMPPQETCHLQYTVGKGIRQSLFHPFGEPGRDRPDIWYVLADGSNVEACVEDAGSRLQSEGLPWLDRMHDPALVLDQLQQPQSWSDGTALGPQGWGRQGSPLHETRVGYTLARLGRTQEARAHLSRAASIWPDAQGRRRIMETLSALP
jgi:hypothetical protein